MNIAEWYQGRSVLVLGGAGFIGSNLARECISYGARVTVIDGFLNLTGAHPDNLAPIQNQIELIKQRIEQVTDLDERLKAAELVIDAMALTAHHQGMANPLYDLELNTISHLHLIGKLRDIPGKRVIYLGSRSQYGRVTGSPITEDTPQIPIDSQGISKLAAENYYRIYSTLKAFDVVSLRISNCYGENQPVSGPDIGLVGSFIHDLMTGRTVEVFGSDQRTKNLIYVADLVKAILAVGAHPEKGFKVYNVGGRNVTLSELISTLAGLIGSGEYRIKPFPEKIRQMDVSDAQMSNTALEALVGPIHQTALDEALANTVNYFRKSLK